MQITPKPGESFEARGLTWTWFQGPECGYWETHIGCVYVSLDPPRDGLQKLTPDSHWPTAAEAIAWAIRTCPGARCGSCEYYRGDDAGWCHAEQSQHPDGWCHLWEYKAT